MADIIPIEPDSCTSGGRTSFLSTYKYPLIIGAVIIFVLIILIYMYFRKRSNAPTENMENDKKEVNDALQEKKDKEIKRNKIREHAEAKRAKVLDVEPQVQQVQPKKTVTIAKPKPAPVPVVETEPEPEVIEEPKPNLETASTKKTKLAPVVEVESEEEGESLY